LTASPLWLSRSAVWSTQARVVDRWPFPRALLGLASSSGDDDAGLRGTSRSSAPWGRVDQWPGPHDLRLFYKDSVLSAPSVLLAVRPARGLAVVCGMVRRSGTPLLGLSKFAPPSASVPGVHSRRRRCSEELLSGSFPREVPFQRGVAFGPELPHSGLVPPLSFLPTAAVCSTWHFSGLLHPETDHGVRQVSGIQVRCGQLPCSSGARAPFGLGPAGAFRRSPCGGQRRRWSFGPRRAVLAVPSRLLPRSVSLCLSLWRHTLRSFPLHNSCTASAAPSGRAPLVASSSANRGGYHAQCVDRPSSPGHRGLFPPVVTRHFFLRAWCSRKRGRLAWWSSWSARPQGFRPL
jgi:hypothetical protein